MPEEPLREILETPALGSSADDSKRAKLRDYYGLAVLGGIAMPRVSEPLGWANYGGPGGLAGGLTHKRSSVLTTQQPGATVHGCRGCTHVSSAHAESGRAAR
jgi:hypothetical protein